MDVNKNPAELALDQAYVAQKQRVVRNLTWRMYLLCVVLFVGVILNVASFLRGHDKISIVTAIIFAFLFVPAIMTLRRKRGRAATELKVALSHGASAA